MNKLQIIKLCILAPKFWIVDACHGNLGDIYFYYMLGRIACDYSRNVGSRGALKFV